MKTKFLILFLLGITQFFSAQDITGTWYTSLDIQGQKLPLVLHVEKSGNDLKGSFDSPMQGAKGFPLDKTALSVDNFSFSFAQANMSYEGKFSGQKIDGTFKQNGMTFPMVFTKNEETAKVNRPQTPVAPYPYHTEESSLYNEKEGNKLAGSFFAPENYNKVKTPVVIMITGSGAQNRDEELFGHKTFLVIADYLARNGIATFRMDDRGIGGSEKGKDGATSRDFAGDISSAVNFLAKKGAKNIGLLGHSEGGMIAPMVANMNKNVKFLVLLAAPGEPITDLMIQQTNMQAKASGATEAQIQENEKSSCEIYSFVNSYKGKNLKKDLEKFIVQELSKNTQQKLSAAEVQQIAASQSEMVASPWFQYFIKYNPDTEFSKIKIPVLAINGSLDTQVSAKENLNGIKTSLTKAGNKNFETMEIPGLNHLMQTATTGSPAEYSQIEETVSPKVLEKIKNWLLNLKD